MNSFSYLHDASFLRKLDNERLKTSYTKIIILNQEELPLETIQGQVSNGSLSINGSSSVRRTGSITFLAKEENNDLTNIDNLLALNKKIKILIGFDNNINANYDKIIWFPLGVFVITQPNISHSNSGVTVNLNFKDKMCLLNGECGGTLPTSVEFDNTWSMYSIVQTVVQNFGGEALEKIFINDLKEEIKQVVTWMGNETLYYNTITQRYTTNAEETTGEGWIEFNSYEEIGYVYTLFTYPTKDKALVTGLGETVCSVLDKIKNVLGNYEYFYDVEGNFIFQEMPNYLNNSYNPTDIYRLDNNRRIEIATNGLAILNGTNYEVDFNNNSSSVYTFEEGSGLITSYSNTPNYMNIKNDFHIWGKDKNDNAIHYHYVIKKKPTNFHTYAAVFDKDTQGEYTGGIRLATAEEIARSTYVANENFIINPLNASFIEINAQNELQNTSEYELKYLSNDGTLSVETFYVGDDSFGVVGYTPADWRVELYMQALVKRRNGIRPDMYEQEILDLFPDIYDFQQKCFKADMVHYPNALKYFIDYLEPAEKLHNYSVDNLGPKLVTTQEDSITRLYEVDVPNIILFSTDMDVNEREQKEARCRHEGQPFANVEPDILKQVAEGGTGESADNIARSLLYQRTSYNESITIQSVPIYYLETNTRITVNDEASNIYGDYIINSMSLPLNGAGTMNISATRALQRI